MGSERAGTQGTAIWRQRRDQARGAGRTGPLRIDSPVTELPRASTADVKRLRKLGLHNVRDLLLHLPFGWESYGAPVPIAELPLDAHATVLVTVVRAAAKRTPRRNIQLTEAVVTDDYGSGMKVIWFNQPYLAAQLHPGVTSG